MKVGWKGVCRPLSLTYQCLQDTHQLGSTPFHPRHLQGLYSQTDKAHTSLCPYSPKRYRQGTGCRDRKTCCLLQQNNGIHTSGTVPRKQYG